MNCELAGSTVEKIDYNFDVSFMGETTRYPHGLTASTEIVTDGYN